MGIYKDGQHVTACEFNESIGASVNMPIKFLDDGSVWARIHWIDVITDTTFFGNAAAVNKTIAAKLLQIDRKTLYNKMHLYDIEL